MSADTFGGFSKVKVEEIRISSLASKKTANITRLVKRLDIQQSMLSPTITGSVIIDDPSGVVYDLPLLGEEVLTVTFASESNNVEFSKDFWVYKPVEINRDPGQQKQGMVVNFVSLDQLKAVATAVEQGFQLTISDIVKEILTKNLATNKNVVIEDTKGVETLILPGWNVWDSIEFLRQRAVSQKYDSPYFFFETNDGFKFVSLEYLIENKKADIVKITAKSFNVGAGEDSAQTTIDASQYRNAENFYIMKKTDTAGMINNGGIMSRTRVYNVLEKRMDNIDLDFKKFGSEVVKKTLDNNSYNSHHSDFLKTIIPDNSPVRYTVCVDKTNVSAFANNVGRKQMFNRHLGDTVVSFSLFGDSGMNAGDIINIDIPRISSKPETDQQLSGNYIITKLNHAIADGQMFTQVEANRFGHVERVIS